MNTAVHEVPHEFLTKWQGTANVMADIFDVPAGLIMRVLPEQIEVLVSSHTTGNPYEADEKATLNTGLYCETVMATRALLQVPDALADPRWRHNPDVALNMISYLGVPLVWPDEVVFGTICVLDSKRRDFHSKYADLLWEIKRGIEADFQVIVQQERLIDSNRELQAAIEQQRADALRIARSNAELNDAMACLTRTQADLLRAEKMAALGSLVAGVAHELNTPIGNAVLAASTLQGLTGEFSAGMQEGVTRSRMHEYVNSVARGSDMLLRSLGQAAELINSFKQVAVDQASVNRRSFMLKDTVAENLLILGPSIGKSGCELRSTVADDIEMDSYPGALGQVLANLINNALLHAFDGRAPGVITLSAEALGEHEVRLVVRDDGVGIPDANLGRIFDPFFTTRLGHGGSGLGLHITYNLVTSALQGSIQVDSAPGQGACFTIVLPRVLRDDAG